MSSHARLSPSNHRWVHCPGSVREEAKYPDIPGTAAIDGTGSHLLLELCLENSVRAESYVGQIIGVNHEDSPMGWVVHQDRADRVQMCLDYITRRHKELSDLHPGSKITIESESKSNPGQLFDREDWYGTVDITITVVNKHEKCQFMEVIDYKDGQGWVNVKDNSQLISYLTGKLGPFIAAGKHIKFADQVGGCRMTIVQPKTNPVIRYEDVSSVDIVEQAIELATAAAKTDADDAPLISDGKGGKGYCRWCKHKTNCMSIKDENINKVNTMKEVIPTTSVDGNFIELVQDAVKNIKLMNSDNLAHLLDVKESINQMFDTIEQELFERNEQGLETPGYELKPGRGSNIWNEDEETIAKVLKNRKLKKDQIYPPKLISPAQFMKLDCLTAEQKQKVQDEYVTFKAGKMKLTKVGYKKQNDAELLFANIPKESVDTCTTDVIQSDKQDNEVSFF